jgi:predicted HAD superfamily Cof-like phosphohydrolase
MCKIAVSRIGVPHSKETRLKISLAYKPREFSEEWRKNISNTHKNKIVSDETKTKMSIAKKDKQIKESHRLNIIKVLKGRKHNNETKEKLRLANINKTLSEEHKIKISTSKKGIPWTEARIKAQINKKNMGINNTSSGIQKIKHWRETFGLPNRETPQLASKEEATLALRLIEEETKELEMSLFSKINNEYVYDPELDQIADSLGDLFFVVTQAAMVHGLDPEMLIDRVYTSNMSKLCLTEQEAVDSVKNYTDKGIETYYTQLPDGKFIIKRTVDNKVLKGINFFEPDWSDLK